MIRIYPDDFDYADFEDEYKKIFARSHKTKKVLNYKLSYLNTLFPTYHIPRCFDDFIIMKPGQIVGLYLYYINDPNFKNNVDTIIGNNKCLKYSCHRNKIIDFFKNNEKLIGIKTCYYCNSSYINLYTNREGSRIQCDLDHFIPQSECPLFVLCLYNFVPSCQICNSRIKRAGIYFDNQIKHSMALLSQKYKKLFPSSRHYNYGNTLSCQICNSRFKRAGIYFNNQIKHSVALLSQKYEKLFPSSSNYNYDNALKFILVPKLNNGKFLLTRKFQDSKDYFEVAFIPSQSADFALYKKEADFFEIIDRYNCHKVEFLNYIDKRRMYSHSYMNLIGKLFPYHNSFSSIIEGIFNFSLRKSEELIFYKIYNDIDNIFDEE